MPVEERTGEDFTREYSRARDELTDEERRSRWLSHDVLHWGDYMGNSSDIQVANARDLPNELGLGENEHDDEHGEIIRIEHGSYGYTKHWVRIDPAPDAGIGTWGSSGEGDDEENDANRQRQWEAHVREVLSRLDSYPLFNDETSSEVMEEWAEAAWDDYGSRDLHRELERWSDDFATWAADHMIDDENSLLSWSSVLSMPDVFGQGLYRAEGGEGGVYFDIDSIAVLFVAHHLTKYADAIGTEIIHLDGPESDTPENVLAGMMSGIAKNKYRRGGVATAWVTVLGVAIDQAWPDWQTRPDDSHKLSRTTPSDMNLRIFADMIEEKSPTGGAGWPKILRAYADLPDATPDEQPAEGATT